MLLYAALLVFILGVLYATLLMALQAYRRTEDFADLQQQALSGLREMLEEAASSPASARRADLDGLVFLSARNAAGRISYASDGRALWQKWICYYYDPGAATLVRKDLALTATPDPPATIPSVASLRDNTGLLAQRVASRISGLSFSADPAVGITLTASSEEASVEVRGRVTSRQ